ncbi:MAG: hypothetical protein EXQ58_09670 [Acidobacteria bacterium]|nr:hypothetical protein [Acidobacteriota bacterium]
MKGTIYNENLGHGACSENRNSVRSLALKPDVSSLARTARTGVDIDQVKVLSVDVAPHQKTRLHDHKVNRVMIYLHAVKYL